MIQDITWVAIIQKYPEGIPDHLRVLTPLPAYDYVLNSLAEDFWSILSMDWIDTEQFGVHK